MAKRTKKVGITGKYGCRYGSSIRRVVRKLETSSKTTAYCQHCGKTSVRRQAAGIWQCRSCDKKTAGAAYSYASSAGTTVRSTIRRLREMKEA